MKTNQVLINGVSRIVLLEIVHPLIVLVVTKNLPPQKNQKDVLQSMDGIGILSWMTGVHVIALQGIARHFTVLVIKIGNQTKYATESVNTNINRVLINGAPITALLGIVHQLIVLATDYNYLKGTNL